MMDRTAFHWYAGQGLASLLPYRKKGLIFGPQVCEWPAVLSMTESGFFMGCSLSLANKPVADEILIEAAAPQPWETAFSEIIQDLERREQGCNVKTATFESFFPEVTATNKFTDALLTPEECVTSIGQRVLLGLMCGVLFPAMALSMLEAFACQEGGWKDLGVGGLRVDDSPLLTSVEEACERALSVYEAWQSE